MVYGKTFVIIMVLSVFVGISTITLIFPIFTDAQLEQKTFVTHSGQVIQTSGDVLDPLYTISTVEFDSDKFLRKIWNGISENSFEWNESEPYLIGLTTDDGWCFC